MRAIYFFITQGRSFGVFHNTMIYFQQVVCFLLGYMYPKIPAIGLLFHFLITEKLGS